MTISIHYVDSKTDEFLYQQKTFFYNDYNFIKTHPETFGFYALFRDKLIGVCTFIKQPGCLLLSGCLYDRSFDDVGLRKALILNAFNHLENKYTELKILNNKDIRFMEDVMVCAKDMNFEMFDKDKVKITKDDIRNNNHASYKIVKKQCCWCSIQ